MQRGNYFSLVLIIISEKPAQVPFRYHSIVHSVDKLKTVFLDHYLIFLFHINKWIPHLLCKTFDLQHQMNMSSFFWIGEGNAIFSSLSTRFPLFFLCPRYPFQCWHLAFLCAFSSTVTISNFMLTNILVFKSIVRHWHTLH